MHPEQKKILIVEDDPTSSKILMDYLTFKGFTTVNAKDGVEGLKRFLMEAPHLILLDVLLPKLDGFEVLRRIRETPQGRAVPILMMSAVYKAPGVQLQAQKMWGADGYIIKPFELSELEGKITALLKEGRAALAADIRTGESGTEVQPVSVGFPRTASLVIGFTGHLKDVSIPQILAVLWEFKETGALTLEWGKQRKEIFFVEGLPVGAESTLPSDGLDVFLIKLEKVPASTMKECMRFAAESGKPLQNILLSLNILSQEELEFCRTYNLKETILSCFTWPEGTYRFRHDDAVKSTLHKGLLRTINIILEGIRRYYSREKLEALFYALKDKTLSLGEEFYTSVAELDLDPSERKLLSLVNGERSVEDIMYMSGIDVTRAFSVLYTLLLLKIIRPLPYTD